MEQLYIRHDDNILLVAPHPDDECIGAGGLLVEFGAQCEVIVLTDGRQGQGDVASEVEKRIRKNEFVAEMKSINIQKYIMLDIEDGTLLTHTDCLVNIDLSRYTKIFVTGKNDEHPDHQAAYLCVKNALLNQNLKTEVYVYEVHTPIIHPSHFIDITETINDKKRLVRYHKSQIKELPYDKLVNDCATYRATLFRMPKKKIEVYERVDIHNSGSNDLSTNINLQKERVNNWVLKAWLKCLIKEKKLEEFLLEKQINSVYIYGYGDLGKILLDYLEITNINIEAVIDRRATQFTDEKKSIIKIEEADINQPVIVTAIFDFDNIKKHLKEAGFEKVYSLRTLIEELEG